MLLLLPVAWLLDRGRTWAVLIPLATCVALVGVIPPLVYPLAFAVTLVALLVEPARGDERGTAPVAGGATLRLVTTEPAIHLPHGRRRRRSSPSAPSSSTGCPTARSMPATATSSTSPMPSCTAACGSRAPSAPTTSSTTTATSTSRSRRSRRSLLMPARRADRAGHGGPVGVRHQRRAGGGRGAAGVVDRRADRRGADPGPGGPRAPAGLLHAGLVGHDPRRRLAHGPPRGHDPDAAAAGRDVRAAAGLAPRAPGRRGVPDPGSGGVRHAGAGAVAPRGVARRGGAARRSASVSPCCPGATGRSSGWAWCRPWRSSSGTTRPGSARRWSPATRWPRCRSGWRTSASSGCSPLAHVRMNVDYLFLKLPALTRGVPVLPPGRPGHVGAVHQPGAPAGGAGAVAGRAVLDPAVRGRAGARSRRCSTTAAAGSSTGTATSWTRSRSSGRWWPWGSSTAARRRGGAGR